MNIEYKKSSDSLHGLEVNNSDKSLVTKVVEENGAIETSPLLYAIEKFRISLSKKYEYSFVGILYGHFVVFLSVFSCLQFIYQLYEDGNQESLSNIELALAILFLCDWFLLFFIAEHKMNHIQSFFSIVDLTTCIPIFLTYHQECPAIDETSNPSKAVTFVLCGLAVTRILRALRLRRTFNSITDEVQRFLADMILRLVVMILFNAAVIMYLEPQQNLRFHTWTYYILVTITTVGYGDISPATDIGRAAGMMIILLALIVVPAVSTELVEKVNEQSPYARAYYYPKSKRSIHVLICGDLQSCSMEEFVAELFHEDHEIANLHAVILHPSTPSYEIQQILKDALLSSSVTYLEGNTLNNKDLTRALAVDAKAIFIMANKYSADPDKEDSKTILQHINIQRFFRLHSHHEKKSFFCMQLIRPENKRHLAVSSESADTHIAICLNEIKMGVIAKAAVAPVG